LLTQMTSATLLCALRSNPALRRHYHNAVSWAMLLKGFQVWKMISLTGTPA
jgi:hypothetical protein